MLSTPPFYFASIRKLVIAFGVLFNDITIERRSGLGAAGDVVKSIKVPLAYGPKQKWITLLNQKASRRAGGDLNIFTQLPRMSFELMNFQYDSNRKLPTMQKNMNTRTPEIDSLSDGEFSDFIRTQLVPVPYDFQFQLNIITKNLDDGYQIMEQIIPFFRPEYVVTIEELPQLGLQRDVPIILTGNNSEDSWMGQFADSRVITWTLDFVAKYHLYPPITDAKVIKRVIANIRDKDTTNVMETLKVEVDPFDATEFDDYSIKETIETPEEE